MILHILLLEVSNINLYLYSGNLCSVLPEICVHQPCYSAVPWEGRLAESHQRHVFLGKEQRTFSQSFLSTQWGLSEFHLSINCCVSLVSLC